MLLVDDDPAVLRAMEREIARGQAQGDRRLEVVVATSAEEALRKARARCPDVVLADYRMPDADGIELLHRLRALCPACVRVMVSGNAGVEMLAEAINVGGVHHFLGKPWDEGGLRATLAEALRYRELLGRNPAFRT